MSQLFFCRRKHFPLNLHALHGLGPAAHTLLHFGMPTPSLWLAPSHPSHYPLHCTIASSWFSLPFADRSTHRPSGRDQVCSFPLGPAYQALKKDLGKELSGGIQHASFIKLSLGLSQEGLILEGPRKETLDDRGRKTIC